MNYMFKKVVYGVNSNSNSCKIISENGTVWLLSFPVGKFTRKGSLSAVKQQAWK